MSNTAIAVHASQPATILGGKALRIPTAGKIRAGIKVLTRTAAGNSTAKGIYDQGLRDNLPFDEIAKKITAAVPELGNPLTPRNVQYFTVRPCDFPNPEVARQILDLYGEDRGDGLRLYRFPVVFAADTWQTVMPHELTTWGTSGKKYWSEYSADGRTRSCMTYEPVAFNPGNRVVRGFGGRRHVPRVEGNGVCDPERCPEYQTRQCNLSGRFVFYIPGIKSISAIEIPTNSFYAMNNAIQKFETIAFMRGGRISGFLDGERTPFFITKKLVSMPHVGNDGKVARVKHWVIDLEAPVDVSELLRLGDDDCMAVAHAGKAVRLLESSTEAGGESSRAVQGEVMPRSDDPQEALHDVNASPARFESPPPLGGHAPLEGETALSGITDLLTTLGVDPIRFQQYADGRYGAGWKLNPKGRSRILSDIECFRSNPQGLQDLIAAA